MADLYKPWNGWPNWATGKIGEFVEQDARYKKKIASILKKCESQGLSKTETVDCVANKIRDLVETEYNAALMDASCLTSEIMIHPVDLCVDYTALAEHLLDGNGAPRSSGGKASSKPKAKKKIWGKPAEGRAIGKGDLLKEWDVWPNWATYRIYDALEDHDYNEYNHPMYEKFDEFEEDGLEDEELLDAASAWIRELVESEFYEMYDNASDLVKEIILTPIELEVNYPALADYFIELDPNWTYREFISRTSKTSSKSKKSNNRKPRTARAAPRRR